MTGTPPLVVPGLGTAHPSHVGASVSLVHGVAHHAIERPHGDPKLTQIAHAAQHDPARWGVDLLLRGHNPKRYQELAREGRLPSEVWAQHQRAGRLRAHLRAMHERYREELRHLHGHRPIGERALLGLAAASHVHADVARALDALRVHHRYPARAAFAHLMHGLEQHEVARIASAFLAPHRDPRHVLDEYRAIRARLERAHTERRRALLRRLRMLWSRGGPALVPVFSAVTHGYSPVQIERLRVVLARGGDIEATFNAIEQANVEARLASALAGFQRWMTEWEASRAAGVQTPLQEPQTILVTTPAIPAPPTQIIVDARPSVPPAPAPIESIAPDAPDTDTLDTPGASDTPEAMPAEDAAPDSTRPLVLQGATDDAETPDENGAQEDAPADESADQDEAGSVRVICAPPPGAHAADGILPWVHLMQGFRPQDEAELARAWQEGRSWEAYRVILARRAAATTAAREAAFRRRLAALGCAVRGPCRVSPAQLAVVAPLGTHFAPEQWTRLTAALLEGVADPLAVWRAIERENVAEAIAVREAAFLRHLSAWGAAPGRWNPAAWRRWAPHLRRVMLDGETSGLVEELHGALGSGPEGGQDGFGAPDARSPMGVDSDAGALDAMLGGFTKSALGAAEMRAEDLGGELGSFAREAIDALQGKRPAPGAAPLSTVEPAIKVGEHDASGLDEDESVAPEGARVDALFDRDPDGIGRGEDRGDRTHQEAGALPLDTSTQDLERALAAWGNNPLGRTIVQSLAGVGLLGSALQRPAELMRLIPRPFPRPETDPRGWWRALTSGQGLDEAAQRELRGVIDADGPSGIEHTIAVYQRMLQGPTDRLRTQREALFQRILEAAQKVAGPAFDPAHLPGGDPFVLLALHVGEWSRVREAILTGEDPLGAFRRAETARQNASLSKEAPARMATMLEALWNARQAAGWVPSQETGDPGDADDAGAPWRHHDPAPSAFHHEPFHHEPFRHSPVRAPLWRGPAHEWFWPAPARERFWHSPIFHEYRPRPLYHLSFGRPMSHRELGRILRVVPALQAHPEGVLREMAGLTTQAIDVRGVDATTGEYVLTPGETFADIAYKLVGDRARWRELEVTNPLRAEGDVRVRIPPGWFGYVPYAVPRRHSSAGKVAGQIAAAVIGGPLVAMGQAIGGLFHRHHHHHHPYHRPPVFLRPRTWDTAGPDDFSGEEGSDAGAIHKSSGLHGGGGHFGRGRPLRGWHHGPRFWGHRPVVAVEEAPEEPEVRRYIVTREDARGALSPDYTRVVAERIAGQVHGLYDGREWLRPDWWDELCEVNPQKPLASNGFWRDIHAGETIAIPGYWPMPASETSSDDGEAGALVDVLRELNPFGTWQPGESDPAPRAHAPRSNTGPRPNLTKRTYVVAQGDWPQKIADAYGAATRPQWLRELQQANPHKPVDPVRGNWFMLSPGETINLPDAWTTGSTEASGDDAAGPDVVWPSLAEITAQAPFFAPLATTFLATHDPEGTWRSYGTTLAPYFERVAPGEALGPVLEASIAGFYIAVPGASGPAGWRKATAKEMESFRPEILRQLGGLTFWVEPAHGVDPGVLVSDHAPSAHDTGALTDRENLTQQTYAVLRGEGMIDIARKFGAVGRPHWFAELRDANPTKPVAVDPKTHKQLGWKSLHPGEIVNIPDAWAATSSPHARPAPGGAPSAAPYLGLQTFPPIVEHGAYPSPTAPPGTTPAAATVDPGTILRVQGILVAFRHAHPTEMTPRNFGDGLPISPDCLGVMTPRTQQALASFQTWSNKQPHAPMDERPMLRTDGVLDPATIAALDSFSAQALGGLAQRPPVPAIPGALPPPTPIDPAPLFNAASTVATAAGDVARSIAGTGASHAGAPDPWAEVFRGSAPPPGPDLAAPNPGVPAPLAELPDVLDRNGAPGVPSLPSGAPHGPRGPQPSRREAPVITPAEMPLEPAPRPRPRRIDPPTPAASRPMLREVDDRLQRPAAAAPEEPPSAKSSKADDGVILPIALTGLSLFSGIF